MRKFVTVFTIMLFTIKIFSQIGFGTVGGIDLYQRYVNPKDDIAYPAAGNAMLNLIYGPKIWLGTKNISLSLEAQINLGLTSFALKDFKGLGAVSFPIMTKINYKGLTGLLPGYAKGFAIGGGIQYSKTELIFNKSYRNKGVKRGLFKTYIIEIDYGVGSFGSAGYFYFRYGFNNDDDATSLNIGVLYNINKTFVKKHKDYMKPKRKK